jgi:hypothetical protein
MTYGRFVLLVQIEPLKNTTISIRRQLIQQSLYEWTQFSEGNLLGLATAGIGGHIDGFKICLRAPPGVLSTLRYCQVASGLGCERGKLGGVPYSRGAKPLNYDH